MTAPDTVLDKIDPGDEVAQRFFYQHCYAAINAIRLITDPEGVAEVICENHEDILIKRPQGSFVGMQIKTRALNQPSFKSSDAQVKTALVGFCLLDRTFPSAFDAFDLTTNHTFWNDADSSANLHWLLSSIQARGGVRGLRSNNPLRLFVEGIADAAGLSSTEVSGTLLKTTLRGHGSDIYSIRAHVREALSECPGVSGLPYLTVAQIADAIIALARDASTKTLKGTLADLYAPGTDLAKLIDDQTLAGKCISKADIVAIIDQFKSGGAAYEDRLSFFHGEMSTGKSTIAELIDYCLGGALQKTPAIQSELVGVQLQAAVGNSELLIERNPSTSTTVELTWEAGGDYGRENLPLAAGQQPIIGDDIYNYSDFLLRQLGSPLLKVRKRKGDPESDLQRLGFRDFYKFCYLDQPDLDSSFFLLEQPIQDFQEELHQPASSYEKSQDLSNKARPTCEFLRHTDNSNTLPVSYLRCHNWNRQPRETYST
ncbi:dsDNA nuclease domain-containing protein [Bradyrhizobium sp. B124]|uniref:dsDNA nuclease domain-containing protein n=1 Tax=Bradyrhizobium sp. B124 TaxID=3140245 RepID=UPI003184344C